jgi:hypothetical protein
VVFAMPLPKADHPSLDHGAGAQVLHCVLPLRCRGVMQEKINCQEKLD